MFVILCFTSRRRTDINTATESSGLRTLQLIHTNKYIDVSPSERNEEEQEPPVKEHELPEWITDYLDWHNDMRGKYPGKAILEDPNAPKVLVRTCFGLCGGLNDRLGQLPTDIYAAKITNRILLINWLRPHPLEEFLEPTPNGIDWRYPNDGSPLKHDELREREITTVGEARKTITSFEDWFDENINELNGGKWKDERVVSWAVVHDHRRHKFDDRFKALGETDTVYGTPSFGLLWHTMFRPVKRLQTKINAAYKEMNITPGNYNAVHCRVRHPRAYKKGTRTENGVYIAKADKSFLPFDGVFKEGAVNTAIHAFQCASRLEPDFRTEPMYFMSDSDDLVQFLVHDMKSNEYLRKHADLVFQYGTIESNAFRMTSKLALVARDMSLPNVHIDKQKGRRVRSYFPSFLDLYLGINARCVALGIGNYASFAAEISGTDCVIRYATEKWGGDSKGNVKNNMVCHKTDVRSIS